MSHDKKIFILTDSCMWEANKKKGTRSPHAIEVVDAETGQVRYIKSGAKIAFLEGEITAPFSQDQYNQENQSEILPKQRKGDVYQGRGKQGPRRTKSKDSE